MNTNYPQSIVSDATKLQEIRPGLYKRLVGLKRNIDGSYSRIYSTYASKPELSIQQIAESLAAENEEVENEEVENEEVENEELKNEEVENEEVENEEVENEEVENEEVENEEVKNEEVENEGAEYEQAETEEEEIDEAENEEAENQGGRNIDAVANEKQEYYQSQQHQNAILEQLRERSGYSPQPAACPRNPGSPARSSHSTEPIQGNQSPQLPQAGCVPNMFRRMLAQKWGPFRKSIANMMHGQRQPQQGSQQACVMPPRNVGSSPQRALTPQHTPNQSFQSQQQSPSSSACPIPANQTHTSPSFRGDGTYNIESGSMEACPMPANQTYTKSSAPLIRGDATYNIAPGSMEACPMPANQTHVGGSAPLFRGDTTYNIATDSMEHCPIARQPFARSGYVDHKNQDHIKHRTMPGYETYAKGFYPSYMFDTTYDTASDEMKACPIPLRPMEACPMPPKEPLDVNAGVVPPFLSGDTYVIEPDSECSLPTPPNKTHATGSSPSFRGDTTYNIAPGSMEACPMPANQTYTKTPGDYVDYSTPNYMVGETMPGYETYAKGFYPSYMFNTTYDTASDQMEACPIPLSSMEACPMPLNEPLDVNAGVVPPFLTGDTYVIDPDSVRFLPTPPNQTHTSPSFRGDGTYNIVSGSMEACPMPANQTYTKSSAPLIRGDATYNIAPGSMEACPMPANQTYTKSSAPLIRGDATYNIAPGSMEACPMPANQTHAGGSAPLFRGDTTYNIATDSMEHCPIARQPFARSGYVDHKNPDHIKHRTMPRYGTYAKGFYPSYMFDGAYDTTGDQMKACPIRIPLRPMEACPMPPNEPLDVNAGVVPPFLSGDTYVIEPDSECSLPTPPNQTHATSSSPSFRGDITYNIAPDACPLPERGNATHTQEPAVNATYNVRGPQQAEDGQCDNQQPDDLDFLKEMIM